MSEEFRKSSSDTNIENNEPRPDITQIIDAIVAVCLGKRKPVEAFQDCADVYKDEFFAFAKDKACQFLEEQLRKSKEEKIRQLSENEFADRLIGSMLGIKDVISAYYNKKINIDELISGLADTGIKEVAIETVEALGVPEKMGVEDMYAVFQMSPQVVAYTALTAAYQELRKAQEDWQIAHDERLRIEAECAKVVEAVTRYRLEMDNVVSKYLTEHYSAFEKGFAAMDKAIVENDIDGYIRGNVEIQKVLGYHVQFTSQEEFDDLMLSDEAFKL